MRLRIDSRGLEQAAKKSEGAGRELGRATLRAGYELRSKVKGGMQAQAPAGEAWPPAHPWTRFGALRNLYRWKRSGSKTTWSATRVLRKRRRLSITGNKKPLARLAGAVRLKEVTQGKETRVQIGFLSPRAAQRALYHAEQHTVPVTPKMRRFLFAVGLGIRTGQLRIPARPAVEPVQRRYGGQAVEMIRQRVLGKLGSFV